MAVLVEIVNGAPDWLEWMTAVGTAGAAIAAAGAAWVAVRQSRRLTKRKLHFASSGPEITGPSLATVTLIVTNDSFRPITLKDAGLKLAGAPRTEAIVSTAQAESGPKPPVTLQDGEAAEWVFNANDLWDAVGGNRPIVQMAALDSRGIEYTKWYSREPLKRLPMRLRERRRRRHQRQEWRVALQRILAERERPPARDDPRE